MIFFKSSSVILVAMAATAGACYAGTIGIPVTGTLNFVVQGGEINFFDPLSGSSIPHNAPNFAGSTVLTAIGPVDFQSTLVPPPGACIAAFDADFGVGAITITETCLSGISVPLNNWFMTFTGLSAGGTISNAFLTSTTFPDLNLSFTSDSLIVAMPDILPVPPSGWTASIQIEQLTPEPPTLTYSGCALAGLVVMFTVAGRRRTRPRRSHGPRRGSNGLMAGDPRS